MLTKTVQNKASEYWGRNVVVSRKEWNGNSFWVTVGLNGKEMMMARHTLV